MPKIAVNGIQIYYEEVGKGTPLLFVHEFAGDYRSWELQMRYFGRRYRCITFSARGYLPSDAPDDKAVYSQDQAIDDVKGLMDALGIKKAHVCGCSMGSYCALLFGVKYPERALSLSLSGCGYGSTAGTQRGSWFSNLDLLAEAFLKDGMQSQAKTYAEGATRVQLQNKDPRGWEEFREQFLEHSPQGSAYTFQGVQKNRPNLFTLEEQFRKMTLPVLVQLGDEDDPGLEASIFLKKVIPRAGLEIFPMTGHAINLEEPAAFNRSLLEFLTAVDGGGWDARDPRSLEE